MMKLKPFDLEKAKAGEKICSDIGKPLFFVGIDWEGFVVVQAYNELSLKRWEESSVFMAPKKRTVFVNLSCDSHWYLNHDTKERALAHADLCESKGMKFLAIAAPVEIEE